MKVPWAPTLVSRANNKKLFALTFRCGMWTCFHLIYSEIVLAFYDASSHDMKETIENQLNFLCWIKCKKFLI